MFYICTRKTELGYGVMVTLQILVLSFQVRILVAQHEDDFLKSSFFMLGYQDSVSSLRLGRLLSTYAAVRITAQWSSQNKTRAISQPPIAPIKNYQS